MDGWLTARRGEAAAAASVAIFPVAKETLTTTREEGGQSSRGMRMWRKYLNICVSGSMHHPPPASSEMGDLKAELFVSFSKGRGRERERKGGCGNSLLRQVAVPRMLSRVINLILSRSEWCGKTRCIVIAGFLFATT